MKWIPIAVDDLRNYKAMCQSAEAYAMVISAIDAQIKACNQDGTDKAEVMALQIKKTRLQWSRQASDKLISVINTGLAVLTDRERDVLVGMYIDGLCTESLCAKLHYEKSNLYKMRDRALHKFAIAMYGMAEI